MYPEPGTRCPDQWRRSGVDVMASRQSGKVCSSRVCPRNVNASSLADRRATMSPRMIRRSGNVPDDTQRDVSRRDAGRALRTCKSCGPGLAQHPGRETSSSARLRWPGKCPVSCQGQPPIGKDAASFGKIFRTTGQTSGIWRDDRNGKPCCSMSSRWSSRISSRWDGATSRSSSRAREMAPASRWRWTRPRN